MLRHIYRFPAFEIALLAALVFQIGSGLVMALRRWKSGDADQGEGKPVVRLQLASGIVLAAFVLNHVAAVLVGRFVLGLDTDYRFAAAGMHAGYAWFFVPYYFLGVAALFAHLACAAWWNLPVRYKRSAFSALLVTGILLGAGFTGVMASDKAIPAQYLATYR